MIRSAENRLGVVLAGGQSRRMGRDKARLLLPDGQTFLVQAIDRLIPLCDRVCVSAGPDLRVSDFESPASLIVDPKPSHGPVSALATALAWASNHGYHACLITPVDTPALTTDHLRRLTDTASDNPKHVVSARGSRPGCDIEPLIAVYPIEALAIFERAVGLGRYRMRDVLKDVPTITITLPNEACRNLNRPSDLDEFLSHP